MAILTINVRRRYSKKSQDQDEVKLTKLQHLSKILTKEKQYKYGNVH